MEKMKNLIWVFLILLLPVGLWGQTIERGPAYEKIIEGNQVTQILYPNITYAQEDGQWKRIEDCRSLLGAGIVRVADDGEHHVKVNDVYWSKDDGAFIVNAELTGPVGDVPIKKLRVPTEDENTRIQNAISAGTLIIDSKGKATGTIGGKKIGGILKVQPILEVENGQVVLVQDTVTFDDKNTGVEYDFALVPGETYHFGKSSTSVNITAGSCVADLYVDNGMAAHRGTFMLWDISSIPAGATINSATLYLYIDTSFSTINNAKISRVLSQAWTEATNYATLTGYSLDSNVTKAHGSTTVHTWDNLDITTPFNADYSAKNTYASFRIIDSTDTLAGSGGAYNTTLLVVGPGPSGYLNYASRTYGSNTPYITVVYTTGGATPTGKVIMISDD